MKRMVLSLVVLLAGAFAQARTIECTDLKTNKVIVSVTDDMGSIVRSFIDINGAISSIHDGAATYSYYYGEYLMIQDSNYDEHLVEVVATRVPGTDQFVGFFNYYQPWDSQTLYATKITCVEP